jgi:hypothetical protein
MPANTTFQVEIVGVFHARAELIFWRYADHRFEEAEKELAGNRRVPPSL